MKLNKFYKITLINCDFEIKVIEMRKNSVIGKTEYNHIYKFNKSDLKTYKITEISKKQYLNIN